MDAPPTGIGSPARRASWPVSRRAAIRWGIGVLALLTGDLAVQMPMAGSRLPDGLDQGGWLATGVLAAVPVLVGALAAVALHSLSRRAGPAGVPAAPGRVERIRDAARRDVRWAVAAAAAGVVLALGAASSGWVSVAGLLSALLVALGWTAAVRGPRRFRAVGGPPSHAPGRDQERRKDVL